MELVVYNVSGSTVMMKLFCAVNVNANLCRIYAQVARIMKYYRKSQSNIQTEKNPRLFNASFLIFSGFSKCR